MDKKIIVTICRQFCSGGMETGKKLAKKLNVDFYDKEIISLAAKESGFTENTFDNVDEKPTNSFLYSVAVGMPALTGVFFQNNDFLTNDKLFGIQSDVIKGIAEKGSSVIVGRCSDYILRDEKRLVRVYLRADMDFRIKRLIEVEGKNCSEKEAENIISKVDKKRASYYSYYTGKEWNSINNYDIVLNTDKIGIDGAVEQIYDYIQKLK